GEALQRIFTAHLRLEEDVQRPPARLPPSRHQARPRYSPVRVSTFTFSPVVMNSGTLISAPVSRVAGLVPPVERSPCRPGSVCATVSSTEAGSSTYSAVPSLNATVTIVFSNM